MAQIVVSLVADVIRCGCTFLYMQPKPLFALTRELGMIHLWRSPAIVSVLKYTVTTHAA